LAADVEQPFNDIVCRIIGSNMFGGQGALGSPWITANGIA
jgi:hypothetical protein